MNHFRMFIQSQNFKWFAVSLCLLTGCSSQDPANNLSELPHPDSRIFSSSSVSSPTTTPEETIAIVGESIITADMVWHHYKAHNGALTLDQIVELLIEFEVLAQEAERQKLHVETEIQNEVRKGAVREFLYSQMIENHGVENLRDDDYEFWYKRAYQRFVHEDGYFGTDAQFVCCFESDLEKCKGDPEVQTCFSAQEPIMEWVHEQLVQRGPYASKEAFQETVTQLSGEVESAKPLAQINVNFWYKPGVPYEEQTGYTKLNTQLVEAIVATPVSEFTKPVRSNHGWHVTYLYEFLPKKNLKPTDPEARREIAEHVYPLVQKRDFAFLVKKLESEVKPTIDAALLLKLVEADQQE